MVLVYRDIVDDILPLLVVHPQTSQVPMSRNHFPATIWGTITVSGTSSFLQHMKPDTVPRHQLPLGVGAQPAVPPLALPPQDLVDILATPGECAASQEDPTHQHTAISGEPV